ncbi:MAG: hypothetical protein ACD_72C00217G0002 [uncultured bacterium]|nr:MAG: hypothetical protein ACD_72C00217G0002 [uncultured bacterium]
MRALILHTNRFETKVIMGSNWPKGIISETVSSTEKIELENCLTIFFCVEESDTEKQLDELYTEIIKTSDEIQTNNLLISPFVHLSNNIAKPALAKSLYERLVKKIDNTKYNVKSSPFGYHKSLMLDIKGHPGSFRYREFY